MDTATEFYRSQIGGTSVINYSYTDFPLKLLLKDVYYFFVYGWALPWIMLPLRPWGSCELDELYPSWKNIYCILVHVSLVLLQLGFIVVLPVGIFFPLWTTAVGVGAFLTLNWVLCKLLNGKDITFHSDEKYARASPEHAHEQWVFLNGVAVGEHWMMANLNRLAITFGRPILGVHNRTSGILFDVIECLIQRNFTYATSDVRICYKILRDVLYDPSKSKVVFILHSQGGIEGGLVLDWLLQEMPQDLLSKLEVYTFGNAANHFNNPHRHVASQSISTIDPMVAIRTFFSESSFSTPLTSPVGAENGHAKGGNPHPLTTTETSDYFSSARMVSAAKDRAIGHVEHYTHSTDFVAMWGVLHFATNKMGSHQLPRFLGRLFNRATGSGGHQFNQHYLDGMFPLKRDDRTGDFLGADEENEFMEEVIKFGKEGDAMENAREAFDITYLGTEGFGTGHISTPVEVHGVKGRTRTKTKVKVKELSRLWSYRNGRSPGDMPPNLVVEAGFCRNATM
ncbi:hypothetical protein NOR_01595 [Metarhizium rileyi]|uniref:Alpha/beta-Hydrolase n=1 Tax=Metarhizium rileyi (strain RCEF 4871) TaxID=1649241 RepID=A0A167J132_METRR|nr:hypothetical protein NOR_01595 [Metarhizium rileyi RCEF 4871]TWU78232.1 hypothetical protein ED733_008053 [Metarhizium rileyi]